MWLVISILCFIDFFLLYFYYFLPSTFLVFISSSFSTFLKWELIEMVPDVLFSSTYDILTLRWCKSNMHSVGTVLHIVYFDLLIFSWAGNMQEDPLLMLGSSRQSQLPVASTITGVDNWYTDSHFVPIKPFCFSFSVQ